MTCFLPSKRATPVLVPATVHYSRNFQAPIFKRVTVVNTVSVVFLPPPLKITSKPWERCREVKKFLISMCFILLREFHCESHFLTNNIICDLPSYSLHLWKIISKSLNRQTHKFLISNITFTFLNNELIFCIYVR